MCFGFFDLAICRFQFFLCQQFKVTSLWQAFKSKYKFNKIILDFIFPVVFKGMSAIEMPF